MKNFKFCLVSILVLLVMNNMAIAQHYTDWTGFEYEVGDYDSKGRVVFYELQKDYTISLPEYFLDPEKVPDNLLIDASHHGADFFHSWARSLPPADWDFIRLEQGGILTAKKGYRWDGASLPCKKYDDNYCPDQHHNFRSTLVHDVLYDLMRMEYLTPDTRHLPRIPFTCVAEDLRATDTAGDRNRQMADMLLYMIAVEDGQNPGGGKGNAWYDYYWVRQWGGIRTHCDDMLTAWKYHVSELTAYPSNGKVELRWKIADDAGKDPDYGDHFAQHYGYNLIKNGQNIFDASSDSTSYIDNTVINGEKYVYSIEPYWENTNQYDYSNKEVVRPARGPGKALGLDGIDDFVEANTVSNDFSYSRSRPDSITLEAWVYPEDQNSSSSILGFNTPEGNYLNHLIYRPTLSWSGKKYYFSYYDDYLGAYASSADNFPPGNWYHVAVTINLFDEGTLYVNGIEQTTFSTLSRPTKGAEFSIGRQDVGYRHFKGLIDEVRIWNVARTWDQIQAGMCNPQRGYETGLIGLWHFNNLTGYWNDDGSSISGTAYDATVNANDGALLGFDSILSVPSGAMVSTATAQDITVELDATGNTTITATQVDAGSSDVCGVRSLAVSPSSFTCQDVGPNTVTLTANDINGNVSTTDAIVTVEDNTAPAALAHDLTVELDATGKASITAAQINAGSSDACGIDNVSVSPSSFTCQDVGTKTVTLTVNDINGNVSTADALVAVEDNIPLVISQLAASPEVLWPPNNKMVTVKIIGASISDNCGDVEFGSCKIVSVTSNEPINGPGNGKTDQDYEITGDLTVDLRAERSGSGNDRIYTITVECADVNENTATAAVNIFVPHDKGKKKR